MSTFIFNFLTALDPFPYNAVMTNDPYANIHKALESATNDNKELTRRRFPRRVIDVCVAEVNGTTYPVHDWSQCGVLFEADGRIFEQGAECKVVMKFKLSDAVTEIPVQAKIVRTGKTQVALEFTNVPKKTDQAFSKVIEDAMAQTGDEAEEIG